MLGRLKRLFRNDLPDLSHVDPTLLRKTHKGRDWCGQTLTRFVPVGCTFKDADFVQFFSHTVEFVNCEISGIVRGAFINGAVPPEYISELGRKVNEFRGNDFSGATLVDVAFRTGIDLSLQEMPTDWVNPNEDWS